MPRTSAYCVHCAKVQPTTGVQRVTLKNGRPAERGLCATCGTTTSKLVKKGSA